MARVRSHCAGPVEVTVWSGRDGQGPLLASSTVEFLTGAASKEESSLALATSERLEANGADSAPVVLTLRDPHGNVRDEGGRPGLLQVGTRDACGPDESRQRDL
jgi:hypothetical protein